MNNPTLFKTNNHHSKASDIPRIQDVPNLYAIAFHTIPIYFLGLLIIPSLYSFHFFLLVTWTLLLNIIYTNRTLINSESIIVRTVCVAVLSVFLFKFENQSTPLAMIIALTTPIITLYYTQTKSLAILTLLIYSVLINLTNEPLLLDFNDRNQAIIVNDNSCLTIVSMLVLSLSILLYSNPLQSSNKCKTTAFESQQADQEETLKIKLDHTEKLLLELQKSLEDKDNSLLTVSHECRNPLNGIQSNLDLMESFITNRDHLEDVDIKKLKSLTHNAKICSEVLLHYINNILDAAKVESNGIVINPTDTDIRCTLEKVWAICSESIRKKNLTGKLTIDRKVPQILRIDSHRLIQVMINLINNSVKFTKKGAITVRVGWRQSTGSSGGLSPETRTPINVRGSNKTLSVAIPRSAGKRNAINLKSSKVDSEDHVESRHHRSKTFSFELFEQQTYQKYQILDFDKRQFSMQDQASPKRCEDRDGVLTITIMDTGCGISEENIPKLFQKFSQVNSDPFKRKIGTGLGLWLCKHIVDGMGGFIKTSSKEDFGTSFLISISIQSGSSPSFRSMASLPPVPLERATSIEQKGFGSFMKAIILSASEYSRKEHQNFLEKCNCEILCNTNSELIAYDCYKKNSGEVGLILVDISPPGFDSFEISKIIREHEEQNSLLPASIITIKYDNHDHDRSSIASSCYSYFDYSLKSPLLLQDIQKVVDQTKFRKRNSYLSSPPKKQNSNIINRKVLVIDDDGFCLEIAKNFFQNENIEALSATTSEEGMNLLQIHNDEIGCILVDYEMPEVNGEETLILIHNFWNKKNKRSVPVYCCSGNVDKSFKEKMDDVGFDDLYSKPINWKKLIENIKRSFQEINTNYH